MDQSNDFCLVLSGGGARGAYQAGGLRALYEICRDAGNMSPFRNLVGVSAGAINAAYIASECNDLERATKNLCTMWRNLTSKDVFATDPISLTRTGLRLVRAVSVGGLVGALRPTQSALLNVSPLRDLLAANIPFEKIPAQIQNGNLNALCVTATDYSTSLGVTFFMAPPHIHEWKRVHRIGVKADIGVDHIMGSASIPLFFPPWMIGNRAFGDGVLRNTAPLSPARRIGATKIIVVGVRKIRDEKFTDDTIIKPTLGRVLSVVINAIFMDAVEVDIERVRIINEQMKMAEKIENFRRIEIMHVQPSQAPSELAEARVEGLPPVLRFLISALGSPHESAEILSYLTFDPIYLNALVDLGYYDFMKQKENLIQFLRK